MKPIRHRSIGGGGLNTMGETNLRVEDDIDFKEILEVGYEK